jgi:integrase
MAIKKYYVSTPKPGYALDRKAKKYFSWGYDIWVNRHRLQERGFPTKADAQAVVDDLKRQEKLGAHGIISPSKIPALIELFQKHLDATRSKHDRVRAKRVFNYLLALLPKKIRVPEIRTSHLQLYVTARANDGVTAATVRRELVPVVSALRSAYLYFESLEDYTPPRVPRPRIVRAKKERVISAGERNKLLDWFFADRGPDESSKEYSTRRRTGQFLLMCLLTLSRPGEIAALRKSDVDMGEAMRTEEGMIYYGIVSVTGQKSRYTATQMVRRLLITSTMREIFLERLNLSHSEYVFTRSGSVTPAMYEAMREACEKCGIKYGRVERDAVSFHTTRHTGITMLLQSGVDLKTVGKLAGQSDSQMTLYYTHASPELVRKASQILEQKMGKNVRVSENLESKTKTSAS